MLVLHQLVRASSRHRRSQPVPRCRRDSITNRCSQRHQSLHLPMPIQKQFLLKFNKRPSDLNTGREQTPRRRTQETATLQSQQEQTIKHLKYLPVPVPQSLHHQIQQAAKTSQMEFYYNQKCTWALVLGKKSASRHQ